MDECWQLAKNEKIKDLKKSLIKKVNVTCPLNYNSATIRSIQIYESMENMSHNL